MYSRFQLYKQHIVICIISPVPRGQNILLLRLHLIPAPQCCTHLNNRLCTCVAGCVPGMGDSALLEKLQIYIFLIRAFKYIPLVPFK